VLLHGFENVLMLPSRDAAFFGSAAVIAMPAIIGLSRSSVPQGTAGNGDFSFLVIGDPGEGGPLSLRKLEITLSSGTSRPSSHMTSKFRYALLVLDITFAACFGRSRCTRAGAGADDARPQGRGGSRSRPSAAAIGPRGPVSCADRFHQSANAQNAHHPLGDRD
jgi:hypothetical protein